MSYLGTGTSPKTGVLSTNNFVTPGTNLWVVTFAPADMPDEAEFEIWHGFALGPGGYFLTYIDNSGFGVGQNGLINEYSPKGDAMFIRKGQTVTLNWSIGTGTAPRAWLYFRTPEVGRL